MWFTLMQAIIFENSSQDFYSNAGYLTSEWNLLHLQIVGNFI